MVLMLAMLAASGVGCARKIRPYSIEGPMWRDDADFAPFFPPPEPYFSPGQWDAADNLVLRPAARVFAFDPGGEAINVNSMDEVPDSSWFTNRLSRERLPVEEVARAACDEAPLDPSGPWTIISAKPDGANPGFLINDQSGRTFVLKFDGSRQPERPTAADVVGSIFYWAAGYYAPCNQIVFFEKDVLHVAEDATEKVLGKKVPLTWERIAPIFETAAVEFEGTFRAAASRFVPGKPLGPWKYDFVRKDDPNDVVPHEDRRELRGAYVLASWIHHTDHREQNSLSTWISEEGSPEGYVRHNYIDFGDSFGNFSFFPGINERSGHTYHFDVQHILTDFVTFGAVKRPWRDNKLGPTGEVLAYYNSETFEPDKYRTSYQNPAFIRATERDKAWMARIIARFTPEILTAALNRAYINNPLVRSELTRIVFARREKILKRWFHTLSPLTEPLLQFAEQGTELCLEDLALTTGIVARESRRYAASAWRLTKRAKLREVEVGELQSAPDNRICIGLPNVDDASPDRPVYLIVDLIGLDGERDEHSRPARVHLYQVGSGAYLIVGLQRPYKLRTPNGRDQYYPRSLALVRLGEN